MTWMQTASGIEFNLVHPTPEMVSFDDMAEHLAKLARFAGATPGVFYSVAEHCCRASDAVLAQSDGDKTLAAYALLHDGHEAYIVDRITPERWAEEEIARDHFSDEGGKDFAATVIKEVPRLLRYRIDGAIHDAAGLEFPLRYVKELAVKRIDLVMLRTEKRDLVKPSGDWPILAGIDPLPDVIKPWDWETARLAFKRRCASLLPCLRTQVIAPSIPTDAPLLKRNNSLAP